MGVFKIPYLHNVDSLYFSVQPKDYPGLEQDSFLRRLAEEKIKSQQAGVKGHEITLLTPGANELNFRVLPGGNMFYQYILSCQNFDICFSKKVFSNNHPILIKLKQLWLWEQNLEDIKEWLYDFLGMYGYDVLTTRISRVDLACHTDEFKFRPTDRERWRLSSYISTSNFQMFAVDIPEELIKQLEKYVVDVEEFMYGATFTGWRFGSGNSKLFLRVYNKSIEAKKYDKFEYFRWVWASAGIDIENVWNIEFQMRREYLKEVHIDTLEQLIQKKADLWRTLTTKWAEFCNIVRSDDNKSRWPVNAKWNKLVCWNGFMSSGNLNRKKVISNNREDNIKQIVGNMVSLGAKDGVYELNDLFNELYNIVLQKECDKGMEFSYMVKNRRNRLIQDIV